jgi:predicted acyl esterase
MRVLRVGFIVTIFAALVSAGRAQPPTNTALDGDIAAERNVMVTMPDGVRLATDIYRPAQNGVPIEGRFPAVVERTPYNKDGFLPAVTRAFV